MVNFRSEDYAQLTLIGLGLVATALFGAFFYREVFPEYKIYQEDYVDLEKFRATYTGQQAPSFKFGVQQIVIPRDDKGPEVIDRCISCHVALKLEHFSPTKIAKDLNGNIVTDADGIPLKIPNDNYVFLHLEEKILELRDKKVIAQLEQEGESRKIKERLQEASKLEELKTAKVGEHIYSVPKVLAMHPLMGRETRPFEFHSIEEIGCTVCHGGNGHGLTTEKAHGPVYDGQYEYANEGPEPVFIELDPQNDPQFASVFNHKPSDNLLFQTTPLLVNNLIQAKCVQCHNPSSAEFQRAMGYVDLLSKNKSKEITSIQTGLDHDEQALLAIINLRKSIHDKGLEKTLQDLNTKTKNYELTSKDLEYAATQIKFLHTLGGVPLVNKQYSLAEKNILTQLDSQLKILVGSSDNADQLEKKLTTPDTDPLQVVTQFLEEQRQKGNAKGTLFDKLAALDLEAQLIRHVSTASSPLKRTINNEQIISGMQTDMDVLTKEYQRGQELFISQACYACHRIAGFSRGGVGPELTMEGLSYPWFVKQSIVWPQADLKTSTMPNTKMDHEEVESLLTFLLAQRGPKKAISPVERQINLKAWDDGAKMWWEKPISPAEIQDVRASMSIFATQGCANCHRLNGFESDVGFTLEKENPPFDKVYAEKQWFEKLFPDEILGSQIAEAVEKNAAEIDKRISGDVRSGSLLEEIEAKYPGTIETYYTNFKYAHRARDHYYEELIAAAKNADEKQKLENKHKDYQDRVHRVLMMYIQEYGLGRIIGPKLNWSGIYRSDQWLMEHFWKPTSKVARSIMPVFPFDNTKFLALTHMLDVLAKQNTKNLQSIWKVRGFNPEIAYKTLCSQCHGEFLQGDGPVTPWIYPIPKNLRNSVFMYNYTRERVINSITNGVQGTPMPPWGEIADDKEGGKNATPVLNREQIEILTDWLFEGLGSGNMQQNPQDILKWNYKPEDVIQELKREGSTLKKNEDSGALLEGLPKGEEYLAALDPLPINKSHDLTVEDIFTLTADKESTVDHKAYYIKKIYYTPSNLAAGEVLFNLNCAVCHGKEGDGTGNRAGSMSDAKPRMLTNLNWLETRDDLRLLRSIKYGVPGTSMIAWGDLTNAQQRLQLVMYIRSLSGDPLKADQLKEQLFKTFFVNQEELERVRTSSHGKIDQYQSSYDQFIVAKAENKKDLTEEEVYKQYKQERELEKNLQSYTDIDDLLTKLIAINKQLQNLYELLGNRIITNWPDDIVFQDYLKFVDLNSNRFMFKDKHLMINNFDEKSFRNIWKEINEKLDKKETELIKQRDELKTKLVTEDSTEFTELNSEIKALEKIKDEFLALDGESNRLKKQEQDLVMKFNDKIAALEKQESKKE